MANVLFGHVNRVLTGTLGAGSAALPVANLANPQGSDASAWRTAAGVLSTAAGAWFTIDAGAVVSWRALVLARTNLTTVATVRWRIGPNISGLSPVYDSGMNTGVVAGFGQHVTVAPVEYTGRYARCEIQDTGNPDNFISVALAYAGPVWQPGINLAPASGIEHTRGTDAVRTRGGSLYVTPRFYQRGHTLVHEAVAAADLWPQLMTMDRTAASGANILMIPDPDSANRAREAVFGTLETEGDVGYFAPSGAFRSWRGRIAERL